MQLKSSRWQSLKDGARDALGPSLKSLILDPTLPKNTALSPYKGHNSLLQQLRGQMEVKVARVKSNPCDLQRPEVALGGKWFCTMWLPGEAPARFNTGQDPSRDPFAKPRNGWGACVTQGHGEVAVCS